MNFGAAGRTPNVGSFPVLRDETSIFRSTSTSGFVAHPSSSPSLRHSRRALAFDSSYDVAFARPCPSPQRIARQVSELFLTKDPEGVKWLMGDPVEGGPVKTIGDWQEAFQRDPEGAFREACSILDGIQVAGAAELDDARQTALLSLLEDPETLLRARPDASITAFLRGYLRNMLATAGGGDGRLGGGSATSSAQGAGGHANAQGGDATGTNTGAKGGDASATVGDGRDRTISRNSIERWLDDR